MQQVKAQRFTLAAKRGPLVFGNIAFDSAAALAAFVRKIDPFDTPLARHYKQLFHQLQTVSCNK